MQLVSLHKEVHQTLQAVGKVLQLSVQVHPAVPTAVQAFCQLQWAALDEPEGQRRLPSGVRIEMPQERHMVTADTKHNAGQRVKTKSVQISTTCNKSVPSFPFAV